MTKTHTRGFTLIELLVVIAIIGILASVVLASLNSARDKGADAAIKSNLNNARAQAELYYDSNSRTYTTVCTANTNNISALVSAASGVGGTAATCLDESTGWAVEKQLMSTTQFYCVDSTGKATTTAASSISGADVTCG